MHSNKPSGRLGQDTSIEEAVRELAVDRDTKDVLGSPPIVDTILKKIDQATVFVPDLTFIAKRPDGRPSSNPNVLLEYGWALKSLGHGRIAPVLNTAFGEPTSDTMPFDLGYLRHPITYHCPTGADDTKRKEEKDGLARALEGAIRSVLKSNDSRLRCRGLRLSRRASRHSGGVSACHFSRLDRIRILSGWAPEGTST